MKTLWHCSPVQIDKFYIPHGGLHFGTYESALCAGLRKSTELYMHKCLVPVGIQVPVLDLGNADAWEDEMKYSINEGDTLVYNNKYEPSTAPSFVVMKPELCSQIIILEVTVYAPRHNKSTRRYEVL